MSKKLYTALVLLRETQGRISRTNKKLNPIKSVRVTGMDYLRFLIWLLTDKGQNPICPTQLWKQGLQHVNLKLSTQKYDHLFETKARMMTFDEMEYRVCKKLTKQLQSEMTEHLKLSRSEIEKRKHKSIYLMEVGTFLVNYGMFEAMRASPKTLHEFFSQEIRYIQPSDFK